MVMSRLEGSFWEGMECGLHEFAVLLTQECWLLYWRAGVSPCISSMVRGLKKGTLMLCMTAATLAFDDQQPLRGFTKQYISINR